MNGHSEQVARKYYDGDSGLRKAVALNFMTPKKKKNDSSTSEDGDQSYEIDKKKAKKDAKRYLQSCKSVSVDLSLSSMTEDDVKFIKSQFSPSEIAG